MPRSQVWIRSGAAALITAMLVMACVHAPKRISREASPSPGTGVIAGKITDEHGVPIQYGNVTIKGMSIWASTGAGGNYSLPKMPVGTYTVYTKVPGFVRLNRDSVHVIEHETTIVDFRLQPNPIHIPEGMDVVH